jgi:hypothetical protein
MPAAFSPRAGTNVWVSYAHELRLRAARTRGWIPNLSDETDQLATADLVGWGFLSPRFNLTTAGRKALNLS